MLVLALDTATPAVTAGVVLLESDKQQTLAERITLDAKAHGELLTPHFRDAVAESGHTLTDLDAIVCGAGPGPFTGLRVGMVTAAALGHALGCPVYPVTTLDAIAVDAQTIGPLLVATDARRKEVYWATYNAEGQRMIGPDVSRPADLAERLPELNVTHGAGQGAKLYAEVLGLPVLGSEYPSPAALVSVAAPQLLSGATAEPLTPLYLRRPDAVEPTKRKRVSPV